MHKRCARRVVHASELPGEHIQSVKCIQIAEKLSRETLLVDDFLDEAWQAWVLREPCPGAMACAFEVDRSDFPVSR